MASLAAKLLAWIYDNNLPSHIQVFKSSHLSQCKWGAFPGEQMASAGREESNPLFIIHSERCCRICSSLVSCFIISESLNMIRQRGKSRMQAWPWLSVLEPQCLCPVMGVMCGSGCSSKCDVSPVALCWHRLKLGRNVVPHRRMSESCFDKGWKWLQISPWNFLVFLIMQKTWF